MHPLRDNIHCATNPLRMKHPMRDKSMLTRKSTARHARKHPLRDKSSARQHPLRVQCTTNPLLRSVENFAARSCKWKWK
jgi:hypothetical protein